jgi:hypothetical protein
MVEHNELGNYRTESCVQLGDCLDDLLGAHVATAIAILADNQDTRVNSTRAFHQVVQVFEITMIARQQHAVYLDRMQEMHGIVITRPAHVCTSCPACLRA